MTGAGLKYPQKKDCKGPSGNTALWMSPFLRNAKQVFQGDMQAIYLETGNMGKRIKILICMIIILSAMPSKEATGIVKATSFDCTQITTEFERMICVNPELSRLDEELNRVFELALKRTPEPEELIKSQKEWLKYWQSRCETDEECVRYQWKYQIARMENIVSSPLHKLQDTVFKYELKESYDNHVCHHMLSVFNSKFSTPWVSESRGYWTGKRSSKDDPPVFNENPSYAEHGKYAYPKFPGVEHDARQTFEMRHTKLPTSPEFDRVSWREGRKRFDEYVSPILIADFDIDNDGIIETVIKVGFWGDGNVYSIHIPRDSYYIYDQGDIDPTKIIDYLVLGEKSRYSIEGRFIRPFIFNSKTYLTSYEPIFGILEDSTRVEQPEVEDMVVQIYHKEEDSAPAWMEDICRYQMNAVDSIDTLKVKKQ